jgi:hypothetical protein
MKIFNPSLLVLLLSAAAFAQHGSHGNFGGPAGSPPPRVANAGGGYDHESPTPARSGQALSRQSPSDILSRNTKLSSNLEKLLPGGMNAQQACAGFKNLGQCVAAVHVSHNLGISFSDLKNKLTGTGTESLGKAIHDLKPSADAKAETKKAKQQADTDLTAS